MSDDKALIERFEKAWSKIDTVYTTEHSALLKREKNTKLLGENCLKLNSLQVELASLEPQFDTLRGELFHQIILFRVSNSIDAQGAASDIFHSPTHTRMMQIELEINAVKSILETPANRKLRSFLLRELSRQTLQTMQTLRARELTVIPEYIEKFCNDIKAELTDLNEQRKARCFPGNTKTHAIEFNLARLGSETSPEYYATEKAFASAIRMIMIDCFCLETEQFSMGVKLKCNHFFHCQCLSRWIRHNPTCPNCRAAIDGMDTIRGF
jgi:hypothetical protein